MGMASQKRSLNMQNKKSLRLFGQRLFLTSAFCLVLTGPGWAQAQGFADLNDVILTVQSMVMGGQPRADVAAFVTRIVADRITSLNYWTPSRDGQPLASAELQALRARFQAWSDAGVNVDQPFAAADWAWKNRAGHCAENAHTAFHILVMALRSTENLSEVKCGDHQYIIWGDVQRLRTDCSVTDLQNLDNTYIVDPWGNFCCSTKDFAWYDYYRTKFGIESISQLQKYNFNQYEWKFQQWIAECNRDPVAYRTWLLGANAPGGDPEIEGVWRRDDGHEVQFSGGSGMVTGNIVTLTPLLQACGFNVGEVTFKLSKTGSGTFSGQIKWRSAGGREWWENVTLKVSGGRMSGGGNWTRIRW
jgi:hypothetical protein